MPLDLSRLRIVAYVSKPILASTNDVSWPIPDELPVTIVIFCHAFVIVTIDYRSVVT